MATAAEGPEALGLFDAAPCDVVIVTTGRAGDADLAVEQVLRGRG